MLKWFGDVIRTDDNTLYAIIFKPNTNYFHDIIELIPNTNNAQKFIANINAQELNSKNIFNTDTENSNGLDHSDDNIIYH